MSLWELGLYQHTRKLGLQFLGVKGRREQLQCPLKSFLSHLSLLVHQQRVWGQRRTLVAHNQCTRSGEMEGEGRQTHTDTGLTVAELLELSDGRQRGSSGLPLLPAPASSSSSHELLGQLGLSEVSIQRGLEGSESAADHLWGGGAQCIVHSRHIR